MAARCRERLLSAPEVSCNMASSIRTVEEPREDYPLFPSLLSIVAFRLMMASLSAAWWAVLFLGLLLLLRLLTWNITCIHRQPCKSTPAVSMSGR
jgi:hypothetical protein